MHRVEIPSKVAVVVVPGCTSRGVLPSGEKRVASLIKNIRSARELGLKKILGDPILEPPPKFARSLSAYSMLKEKTKAPLLMGVGNVTELMDADSIGINALLSSAAVELGIAVLLTTEASPKTKYAVREVRRGLDMALLANARKTTPKDLGICLLAAKGKTRGAELELPADAVEAVPDRSFTPDRNGNFHICVDFKKNKIIAAHIREKYDYVVQGNDAESIWKKIRWKGLVSDLDHAAYLGRELQKAETCLKHGKPYIQDT